MALATRYYSFRQVSYRRRLSARSAVVLREVLLLCKISGQDELHVGIKGRASYDFIDGRESDRRFVIERVMVQDVLKASWNHYAPHPEMSDSIVANCSGVNSPVTSLLPLL